MRLLRLSFLLLAGTLLSAAPSRSADSSAVATIRLEYMADRGMNPSFLPALEPKRPRLALVLSGGGARGAAQVGVLKALVRHHIPIDFIAATSMGAIIGGLYASGYTVAEIESTALHTNWDEVLSLNDQTRRRELFLDQKVAHDRSFLAVRFQGFEPVIPSAVSSGQRLTDWLSSQMLQALYHADPDFDHLKVPFRAISTDLVSGNRVVEDHGSLAEAIRASATTPLLFTPIERDSMRLIDGGILANVPVDVAREQGLDAIVAINTTSGLRRINELNAPWQTVDQLMSISMQVFNIEQLRNADIVITPDIGRHLTFDLTGLDSLVARGDSAAERKIPEILALLEAKEALLDRDTAVSPGPVSVEVLGGRIPDSLWATLQGPADSSGIRSMEIRRHLRELFAVGRFADAFARVERGPHGTRVRYFLVPNPVLRSVQFAGCHQLAPEALAALFQPMLGRVIDRGESRRVMESVLRAYRRQGYSLARIDSTSFDAATGALTVTIDEGVIAAIDVQGGVRTVDAFVLKEFQLQAGDVFRIDRADRGISNIMSTTLFEFVYLETDRTRGRTDLIIRLRERPSQLVRLGMRVDNERHLQGLVDIRDENFRGSGLNIGLTIAGGDRNTDVTLEYKMQRLFETYLTLSASAFYRTFDSYVFEDGQSDPPNRWHRVQVGEYTDERYGGSLGFSGQLERLGTASVELVVQDVRLRSLENTDVLAEHNRLVTVRGGTIVDSKDEYPFPRAGVGLSLFYEFSLQGLGSDVGYNAMMLSYEWYTTWGRRHTIHPRLTMDFADRTMPLSQQFRLGGMESFFGVREDDRRGRQLILLNLEYRYQLPFTLLFNTYAILRYDLGSISALPEEIKFTALRHGVGLVLAWDTPVGPAAFGAGKSFFFSNDTPPRTVQQGPLLWYFSLGYRL